MIIARYKIEYHDKGIIQEKNLISHQHYLSVVQPLYTAIDAVERANKGRVNKESKQLKSILKSLFGEHWFTNQSAMFRAIETGEIVTINGKHRCKITKIPIK